MIQIAAAALVILFSFGAMCFIAAGATKPYDSLDVGGILLFLSLFLAGLGRLVWIAFS